MNEIFSLEDLVEQFLERCRAGENLDVDSFAGEHPAYAAELRRLLPLMRDMEAIRNNAARKTEVKQSVNLNLPDPDYRLIRKIGSGGMGTVFEALQISLNRKVAVKLLSSQLLKDAQQRSLFENEAKVIAMLHHPNIVKILSAGCGPESCYYAMELVEGKGLDQCHFTDMRELARIGLQTAQALAYAHRCGIMHRDIKPANLLLDSAGEVHVSDFGLAFVLHGGYEFVEKNGFRSGTLRYMAPERLAHGINTFSSDQYSFGAAFYELAAGTPFLQAGSKEQMMQKICGEPVLPLKISEPDLAAIINKSVSYHPEDRYRNMDELAEDLQHFLNHEPVAAAEPSPVRRLILWSRRNPAVAALSAAAVCCAAAFVIALAIGYIQTNNALKLAKRNASVADTALSRIFTRISEQPPSQKNTSMLSELLPYYQLIAGTAGLSDEKICEANFILGECSMRAGSYSLAEKAFRNMMKYRNDPFPVNRLADSLMKQGKKNEAAALYRAVAERNAYSDRPADRYEAVRALLALSDSPERVERTRAFSILEELLLQHPDNPEYRFQYACLLGGNPRLFRSLRIPGVEPNAIVLLLQLAEKYPDNPEYGTALLELMLRKSRYVRSFQEKDRQGLVQTVNLSERLLGRWPNDPQIVSAAVRLHQCYIEFLRRRGENAAARKETERLLSILEILFYHPDISDTVKENLFRLQLQRLKLLLHDGRKEDAAVLQEKITRELEQYHGEQLPEFRRLLEESGNISAGEIPRRPARRTIR